ncbi:metal ABC transporter solute-binding protein, Zn/Mn family [Segnochrobactrum spirostomi]|uniref:Cation ABC transporter substrate-binding protein n=1 Tax=Segnochrobactrum spirostomi TaxID=2608987 RepID=A0A6A7Y344_9HYPH|nr:zinc ABC transporter substrate-binding protein [Segnochrobactrum spirostomi]MQT12209.1 cation ABC transporter substrate-binding protein [Segnochrobactrum spirostomi]
MRPSLFAAAVSAAFAAALCVMPAGAFAATTKIVAAENFYGDVAKEIGGSHVEVTSILSNPDEDPHLFETSPSTARALVDAAIVVYNGADYDPWMPKLIAASPAPNRSVIVAADLIGAKSGDNPHLWYKPATLPAVAKALAADLSKRDPAHAADFAKNLAAFDAKFEKLDAKIAAIKAKYAGTTVTATEPVFGYMAEALGFKMLNGDFQLAVMNDTEPSPAQVAAFEQSLSSGTARILFYNSQVTDATTTRMLDIAKKSKVAVVGVTETEPKGKTIADWFGGQLAEVEHALGGLTQ